MRVMIPRVSSPNADVSILSVNVHKSIIPFATIARSMLGQDKASNGFKRRLTITASERIWSP